MIKDKYTARSEESETRFGLQLYIGFTVIPRAGDRADGRLPAI